MSYILEGLKKLEQKRQQEKGPPDLLAFQAGSPRKPGKRPIWPYLLFALLLLNAGAIIWWVAPWQSTGRNAPAQPSVAQPNTSIAAAAHVEIKEQSKAVPVEGPQQSKAVSTSLKGTGKNETKESSLSAVKKSPVPRQSPVVASISLDPHQARTKNKPPADGRIVKLEELPSEIRNSLPVLKMSAHFYSTDKQTRFSRINDRILHEGEVLSEGLKVEEINSGGAVFSYKGYRFLVGINDK